MSVIDAVRDAITTADKPLRYYDIAHHPDIIDLVVEPDDVHRALRGLIRGGEVVKTPKQRYAMPDDEQERTEMPAADPLRAATSAPGGKPPPEVVASLDQSVAHAQEALDRYIQSLIGDDPVVKRLVALRDAARDLRDEWDDG